MKYDNDLDSSHVDDDLKDNEFIKFLQTDNEFVCYMNSLKTIEEEKAYGKIDADIMRIDTNPKSEEKYTGKLLSAENCGMDDVPLKIYPGPITSEPIFAGFETIDNKYLYLCNDKGYMMKYKLDDEKIVKEFGQIHDSCINSIAGSTDGKWLFTSDSRGCVKQFCLLTDTLAHDYGKFHQREINSIMLSQDNKRLYTSDGGGYQKELDIIERKLVFDYGKVHNLEIYAIAITQTDEYLFTSDMHGKLKQFNVQSRDLYKDYGKIHTRAILAICCSHDSKYLFTADMSGNLKQFSILSETIVREYESVTIGRVTSIKCTNDNKFMFVSDDNGGLKEYSIADMKKLIDFGAVHKTAIKVVIISNDDKYLYCTDRTGTQKRIKIKQDKEIIDWGEIHGSWVNQIAITPDNQKLFSVSNSGNIKQFSIDKGKKRTSKKVKRECVHNFGRVHHGYIKSICISNDNEYLFTSDVLGTCKQWSIKKVNLVRDMGRIHESAIRCIICSEDSKYLFTSDIDGVVKQFLVTSENGGDGSKQSNCEKMGDVIQENKEIVKNSGTPDSVLSKGKKKIRVPSLKAIKDINKNISNDIDIVHNVDIEKAIDAKLEIEWERKVDRVRKMSNSSNPNKLVHDDSLNLNTLPPPTNFQNCVLRPSHRSHKDTPGIIDNTNSKKAIQTKGDIFNYDSKEGYINPNIVGDDMRSQHISKDDKSSQNVEQEPEDKVVLNMTMGGDMTSGREIRNNDSPFQGASSFQGTHVKMPFFSENLEDLPRGGRDQKSSERRRQSGLIKVQLCFKENIQAAETYHDFGKIMVGEIFSMATTPDAKYLFVSDNEGNLKQICIETKLVLKDYGRIHKGNILSITVTRDNKYLFTSDTRGHLKQFMISEQKELKNYDKVHTAPILCIKSSWDNKYLFTASSQGILFQWSIPLQDKVREYPDLHQGQILCLASTTDSKFQFSSDNQGYLKQIIYNLDRFVHGKVMWTRETDFFSLDGIFYYNYLHNLNYFSDRVLHRIVTGQYKSLNEFLSSNWAGLKKAYKQVLMISKKDILIMIYAYEYCGLKNFIPPFIKAITKNTVATKPAFDKYYEFQLKTLDDDIGCNVMKCMVELQWTKVKNLIRGTQKLLETQVVYSEMTTRGYDEKKDYKRFCLPEKGLPPIIIECWKFDKIVNITCPSIGFVEYLTAMLDNLKDDNETLIKDPNYIWIENQWELYQKQLYFYLGYSCIPLALLYTQTFFFDEESNSRANIVFCWLVLITAIPLLFYEIFQWMSVGMAYFDLSNIIDIIAIIMYFIHSIYMLCENTNNPTTVSIYVTTMFFVSAKFYLNLSTIDLIRNQSSTLIEIIIYIKGYYIILATFIMVFSNIFYITKYFDNRDTNRPNKTYLLYLYWTYDTIFGNWADGSPIEELSWIYALFIVFTILFTIIVGNVQIALVCNAYAETMENKKSNDTKSKLKFVIEVIKLRRLFRWILYKIDNRNFFFI